MEKSYKGIWLKFSIPFTHSEVKNQQCGRLNAYIVLYEVIKENPWKIPCLKQLTVKAIKFTSASL